MSKYIGVGVTIKSRKTGGIDTSGSSGVIEHWDGFLGKYKVDFGNGFCGWYKRSELVFDS